MTSSLKVLTTFVVLQLMWTGCGPTTTGDAGLPDSGSIDAGGSGGGGGGGGASGGGPGGGSGGGGQDADAGSPFDEVVRVLLFDAQADFPELLSLNRTGIVRSLRATGSAPLNVNWNYVSGLTTNTWPAPDGGTIPASSVAYLLFLHTANGGGSLVRLDVATGAATVVIPSLPFSGWDEAIPVFCDNPGSPFCLRYVFHKRSSRTAAIVDFKYDFPLDGGAWSIEQRDALLGTAPDYAHWWRVEAGRPSTASQLGMYSPGDGGVATVRVQVSDSDAGMFERSGGAVVVANLGNVGANWAQPTPLGTEGAEVFFHGGATGSGAAALVRLAPAGLSVLSAWPAATWAPWSDVVMASPETTSGQLLFFGSGVDGGAMLGNLKADRLPVFQPGARLALDGGYELLVPVPFL